ncbi:MAG: trypsin-like peptidase domain-containing protein [Acidobacteriia bacterium]|nr:trypsin-like peptidase domain-containing protein [Terriglobia bacterium]
MGSWQRFLIGGLLACSVYGQEAPRSVSPLRASDPTLPRPIPDSIRQAPVPPAFSVGPLSAAERRVHIRGSLVQAGVRRMLPRAAGDGAVVSVSPEGQAILTASLRSPGARSIRLHFRNFHAGSGQVWVFAPGDQTAIGPYTGDGVFGTGEFWAGGVDADTVTVAYLAPPGISPARFPFTIDSISHVWPESNPLADGAASCNLDVACYPAYQSAASASVKYEFISDDGTGAYTCSGAMINTRASSGMPYLLTAHHCISSDTEAKTIQAHFLYQTSTCNGPAPNPLAAPTVLGGTYLAGADISGGDFSLVALTGVPGGVTFLGWNNSLDAAASVAGVHHPRGSYARIALGTRGADIATAIGTEIAPSNRYYEVNWTMGITEPGSSGSPLLNDQGQIVGTLTGAAAPPFGETACQARPFSLYGRFSNAYAAIASYLEDGSTATPKQSQVSAAVNPDPIYQQSPDSDGFQWAYAVRITESAGVKATITGLKIGPTDYSSQLAGLFGTTTLPAFGTLASGMLRAKNLSAPVTLTVEVDGVDAATGHAWQSFTQAPFLGPKVVTPAPSIMLGGLGNGASFLPAVAPGSLLSIFGSHLAFSNAVAPSVPLPLQLAGVTVAINGVPAPLFAVTPSQLNVQVPYEVQPGTAQVTVTVGGQSDTKAVEVVPVAPGVFSTREVRLLPASGGRVGDYLTLYLTGQGPVTPAIATGAAPAASAPLEQLPRLVEPVQITIGGVPAPVIFAGIPNGLVGIAQMNFQIPAGAPLGDQPLIVLVGHQPAKTVTVTVNP